MSQNQPLSERLDMRQLRTQAKDRLKTLPDGAKLADAHFAIARERGFASWPKLVEAVEIPILLARMKRFVERGDAASLDALLRRKSVLRKRIDDPLFAFDSPALVWAAGSMPKILTTLVKHGADPNARTSWWAGGFSALDAAKGETVDALLALGTRWDVHSAAAHGRLDVLRDLLDADPALVNARGGDGQTALHVAKTPEVARFLIERGADLEIRDLDHESTPAQYQIDNEPVLRVLLAHGAQPDAFIAAVVGDASLLRKGDADARVGKPPFKTVKSDGGHIYDYKVGRGATPQAVAAAHGHDLYRGMRPARDLVAAAWAGDEAGVRALLHVKPEPQDAGALAQAAIKGRADTIRLLLEAGFDPLAPGMDSGTALHVACWFGWPEAVRLLLPHVPLETRDANHGSPPLGWATHGAAHCRNSQGRLPRRRRPPPRRGRRPRRPRERRRHVDARPGGRPRGCQGDPPHPLRSLDHRPTSSSSPSSSANTMSASSR